MLKLLSAGVGLFLVVHAMSCGFFFCVRLPGLRPLSSGVYDELRDISVLAGAPAQLASQLTALRWSPCRVAQQIRGRQDPGRWLCASAAWPVAEGPVQPQGVSSHSRGI